MDTAIYVGTVFLTVVWSVWIYLLWADRANLPEDSGLRFLLIVGPSTFFLIIALSGWRPRLLLRVDLIALVAYNVLTLLSALALVIVFSLERISSRTGYKTVIIVYYVLASVLTVATHALKFFPSVVMDLSQLISQGFRLDFLSLAWVGVNTETQEVDLVSMLNKILIALLSYIPVSVIRYLSWSRSKRKLEREIQALRKMVEELARSERSRGQEGSFPRV